MDEVRRRDKLDDALLFVMGSLGILFGLVQVFTGFSTILQFIAPVALLGWVLPFYFGYVRGSIKDSMVDRYRGWIFLVVGLTLYSVVLTEEELSRLITDPNFQWIVPVGFLPFLLLFMYRLGRFRRFVLGPNFPLNQVLSRSAYNAATVAALIAGFGALFAIARFQLDVATLLVEISFALIAIIVASVFMRRSNQYARRVDWVHRIVKKNGRYYGHRRVELARRVLLGIDFVLVVPGAVIILLARYSIVQSTPLLFVGVSAFGWALILLVPWSILFFLTRSKEVIDFDGPFPEKPQVNYPI
jgi:hypothetical protein